MKQTLKENKFYLIILILVILLFNIRLPYYINAPGGTIDIGDRIEYKNAKKYEGSLNMLYVTEYVATIPTYLLSYLFKDWEVENISNSQISDETPEEINTRNKIMLENSINNAKYVAYMEASCKVEIKEKKNIVLGTTIENGLFIGDEILEIDHQEITNLEVLKKIIENRQIGDKVVIKIKRKKEEKEKEVEIKEIEGKKALGVVIVTNYELETDPEIELKFKESESGSSGGLMMALSIYSAISEEDILKGRNIAGTGTIDMEGNVGEIAGIKYKIMGAAKNKMDIVLVPSENYEEALNVKKEKNYDLEIIEVKTFKDAIEYLKNSN